MLTSSIFVKTMNELITSAVFLASSLYGGGQVASTVNAIPVDAPKQIQSVSIESKTQSTSKTETKAQITSTDTSDVEAYLRDQFGEDAVLVDIARCESNFHQFDKDGNIIRGIVNRADVGVMQINEKYHADMAKKLGLDLYTIAGNVAYAKHLYGEQGTAPWKSSSKCWAGDIAKK